jgi:hypothetical protein
MAKDHNEVAKPSRRVNSLFPYAVLFATMAYIAKIYHFRLVGEIGHYQDTMPNNSIPLPNFRRNRHENKSVTDGWAGLKQTEKALIDWQEAIYAFRLEMTVRALVQQQNPLKYSSSLAAESA